MARPKKPKQEGLTIKFSECPIKKRRGEIWRKLQNRDLSKPAILADIAYLWNYDMSIEEIRADTFEDFTEEDWMMLMVAFYRGPVFGMKLIFDHPNGRFTTFRAYDWAKALWYSSQLGKEFKIVVKGVNDGVSLGARRPRQRKLKVS